jgi:hypothetical protein
MAVNSKPLSDYDQTLILQKVYNPQDNTLATAGFLNGRVGNRIEVTYPDATTEVYSFFQLQTELLLVLTVTYVDASKDLLLSAERTA